MGRLATNLWTPPLAAGLPPSALLRIFKHILPTPQIQCRETLCAFIHVFSAQQIHFSVICVTEMFRVTASMKHLLVYLACRLCCSGAVQVLPLELPRELVMDGNKQPFPIINLISEAGTWHGYSHRSATTEGSSMITSSTERLAAELAEVSEVVNGLKKIAH